MKDVKHLILALHSPSSQECQKAAEILRHRGVPGGPQEAEALLHVLLHDPVGCVAKRKLICQNRKKKNRRESLVRAAPL